MDGLASVGIYSVEYFSVLKRKGILTHVTAWMNCEDIMLSETRQAQKINSVQSQLYEVFRIVKLMKTESRMVVARICAEGK